MGSSPDRRSTDSSAVDVPAPVRTALRILLEAYECAQELKRSVWDFAVEIQSIRAAGLSNSQLRWLVCKGHVAHAAEITQPDQDSRDFRRTGKLTFSKRTCFVLTQDGAAFTRGTFQARAKPVEPSERSQVRSARDGRPGRPSWDRDLQELRLGGVVVKQFKVPAPNQETILAAFEEEGWPARIDDPLPPHADQDSKRRLHDTITSLNRNQKHHLIRFLGDGSGQGIRWELLPSGRDPDGWPGREAFPS
jgi:hypothetical protein